MDQQFLKGLVAAPFTPMNDDGTVAAERIAPYADFIADKGCLTGVFICGTSGESVSLTLAERMQIAAAWVKAARGRYKVIVHVGGMSQPDCVALAAHAQAVGADAIGAMAPCFFKPASVADLVSFFEPVAKAAESLPFYYYNMPSITGVSLPVHQFLHEGRKRMPNLKGVKFTHNDLMQMQQCVALDGGEFEVLNGFDEILLAGWTCGCRAAVGSTYNYVPRIYQAVIDALDAGNLAEARRMSAKAVRIVDVLVRHGGGTRAGKIFMKLAGFDCGPCRLPIAPITAEEVEQTRRELEQTEFFDYI